MVIETMLPGSSEIWNWRRDITTTIEAIKQMQNITRPQIGVWLSESNSHAVLYSSPDGYSLTVTSYGMRNTDHPTRKTYFLYLEPNELYVAEGMNPKEEDFQHVGLEEGNETARGDFKTTVDDMLEAEKTRKKLEHDKQSGALAIRAATDG